MPRLCGRLPPYRTRHTYISRVIWRGVVTFDQHMERVTDLAPIAISLESAELAIVGDLYRA